MNIHIGEKQAQNTTKKTAKWKPSNRRNSPFTWFETTMNHGTVLNILVFQMLVFLKLPSQGCYQNMNIAICINVGKHKGVDANDL